MCACKLQISSQTLKAADKHADCCVLMCPDSCTLSWHSKCTQMRTHGHETGNFLLLANLAIPRTQVHTGSKLCALKEKTHLPNKCSLSNHHAMSSTYSGLCCPSCSKTMARNGLNGHVALLEILQVHDGYPRKSVVWNVRTVTMSPHQAGHACPPTLRVVGPWKLA